MSGFIRAESVSGPQSMPESVTRRLANGRMSPNSPLKNFGQAKKKIIDIFGEIYTYVEEGNEFLARIMLDSDLVTSEQYAQFAKYKEKVAGIREILKRDRMKVAFFGRTSNGKSSVINAMLRNRILPSGIGHTTNCFLQVEGINGNEAYLITEPDSDKKVGLNSISQLASALSNMKLNHETLIRIYWPKDLCQLLKEDVVFVDSPGIDVTPDLDGWIEKFCLDADVFVLVSNAESTLTQTEKNFFHKVSERLSKPNIFILNNRWDASALELDTMQEVKEQHLERNVEFLADELKVASRQEAENRVFFVSAREALLTRVNQDRGTPTPTGLLLEGFQGRLFEFANFERKFEECISQSAVETKFALHAENGKEITMHMYKFMESICLAAVDLRMSMKERHDACKSQIALTHDKMDDLTADMKDKMKKMSDEVEVKVDTALSEEIRRLSMLVDDFDEPFNPDPMVIREYKQKLNAHVESGLLTNLRNRSSATFSTLVKDVTSEMAEQLRVLVPDDPQSNSSSILPNKSFEMTYRLDCRILFMDFNEDIDFRFSFGMSTLLRRFTGFRNSKQHIYRPISSASTEDLSISQGWATCLAGSALNLFSSPYSGTALGFITVTGLVGRAAGWRVIGFAGSVYFLLYLYERLTWTNDAKKKAFKRQYVDYASHKLKQNKYHTSSNCGSQVLNKLESVFDMLCQHVHVNQLGLKDEMERLEQEMVRLDEASKKAVCLKNKASFADSEIKSFTAQYLNLNRL